VVAAGAEEVAALCKRTNNVTLLISKSSAKTQAFSLPRDLGADFLASTSGDALFGECERCLVRCDCDGCVDEVTMAVDRWLSGRGAP
jgi:hypothetical protein